MIGNINKRSITRGLSFAFINILFLACNCYGHSDECVYDEEVNRMGLSIDIHGNYEGGGVCQNCRDNTAGTNCDKCMPGYYRPRGRALDDRYVCESMLHERDIWVTLMLCYS